MWFVLGSVAWAGTVWSVDAAKGPLFTVEAALAEAAPGDTIEIGPGTYVESIRIETDGLTLRGRSHDLVHLQAGDRFQPGNGFLVAAGVALRVESVTLSGVGEARALRAENAQVTLVDTILVDGGMLGNGSLLYVDDSSTVTLRSAQLLGGDAGPGSGGLVAVDGVLDAIDTQFREGRTERRGGALYCSVTSSCSVQDSEFVANAAGDGGAVYLQGTAGAWRRNVFCGNDALGGGAFPGRGGAVWADVSTVHENTVFQENRALQAGGALFGAGGSVALWNSDLLGNLAVQEAAALGALAGVTVEVRNSLVAYSSGAASHVIYADPSTQSVAYTAFFENAGMALQSTEVGTNQPPDMARPRIAYVAGDCLATDVTPGPSSTLIDAGDPLTLDPDGSRSDIGSTGGPWACNRIETPGNEVDEDCDGRELCYPDLDGDGFGEPTASPVVSDDLDCTGEGESRNADDVCPGHDDALDCDSDGIPDGCDTPCQSLGPDELSPVEPVERTSELMGGAGCNSTPLGPTWLGLLLMGVCRRRR